MIVKYKDYIPKVHESSFISETSTIIGRVSLKENVNIWYGTVLRGDVNYIEVGRNTNIQDNSVVHTDAKFPTIIGDNVTIGHNAVVHACTIHNNVLIGMGAIILDGAVIEENVIIGAGTLIPPGKRIPKNSLVIGAPGKVVRELSKDEVEGIKNSAILYVNRSKEYMKNKL